MKIRILPLYMSRQEFFVRLLSKHPLTNMVFSFLFLNLSLAIVSHFAPSLMVWLIRTVTVDAALFWLLVAIFFVFSMGIAHEDLAAMSELGVITIILATVGASTSPNPDRLLFEYIPKIFVFFGFFFQGAELLSATTKAIDWAMSPLFAALNRHTKQAVSRLRPTKTTLTHGG